MILRKFVIIIFLCVWSTSLYAAKEIVTDQPSNGVAIDDNTCFDRTLTINTDNPVANIIFRIDLSHTYRADLDITLTSPEGTSIYLTQDDGSSADNLSVVFFDTASESITQDTSNHTLGSFLPRRPEKALSSFNGEDPHGDWTLRICDDAGADTGTYNESTLIVEWDTDGDGILDGIDIDDDNDGIPDLNESLIDLSEFKLNGDAIQLSDREVQLTAAENQQFGTAMSLRTVDLSKSFSIDADVYLGTKDGGADGIAFVMHNDPRGSDAYGNGEGSTLGAMANGSTPGIANGLSFEFDTYKSSSGSDDPSDDHTQIRDTDYKFNDTAGRVTDVTQLNNLEDGNWHTFHLEWDADIFELKYWIDGAEMPGIFDANLADNYFDGSSEVYFGFTAATGGLNNLQKIRNVSSRQFKDTDGDSIPNSLDLDSDNDGIPDNVEAQPTDNYVSPSGSDTDGDGLDDAYDTDNGGTAMPLPDTDGDSSPDFLDRDSDNDGYSDCEEGLDPNSFNVICPVNAADVGTNGLVDWADNGDDYSDVSGAVTTPSSDLYNETGDNSEVGYREFLCGKALTTLTRRNWKLVSIPCNTGDNSVEALLQNVLGSYGEPSQGGHWVMYRQSGTDNYEVDPNHTNTDKLKLTASDTLTQGISYWIIWDDGQGTQEVNLTIDETLGGITPTVTTDASDTTVQISDPDFTKVYLHSLPDNLMTEGGDFKKYMAGNPFPYAFEVSNLYFSHGSTGGTYNAMGSTANDDYINATFYKHNSPLIGPSSGYDAVNPATPGFDLGGIKAMEGFFIKIEDAQSQDTNSFAYPLIMKNRK